MQDSRQNEFRDNVIEECAEALEQIYKQGTVECGIAFYLATVVRELKTTSEIDLKEKLEETVELMRLILRKLKETYKPEEEWPL